MEAPSAAGGGGGAHPPSGVAHPSMISHHDAYGFFVRPEMRELYQRFAPIYEAEEAERSARWDELLAELAAVVPRLPDEDDAALLQHALAHLGASTSAAPPQAAALLQRLSVLVQAGLPMAKRGAFWRLFLNVDARRREGEYARLCAEVEQLEAAAAAALPPVPPAPGADKLATVAAAGGGAYTLAADATSAALFHRVDVFSVTVLEDSPHTTPAKDGPPGRLTPGSGAKATAGASAAPAPAATPASTLLTPQGCSTTSSSTSSGAAAGSAANGVRRSPGSTARRAERWRQQDFMAQIDKDLHRTFPGHPAMDDAGRATLRRILGAYAARNGAVGYCQGLNFLAAALMLFMGEEDAFWSLCAVVEDLLGSAYFDERMVLPQVDVLVFGHLLQGRFPTLWRHLAALEVDAASVTLHWFLCLFLNSLPLDSTLRVWDLLFFEGSAVVLFRMALALIEIYEQALMCTRESSDAYMLLQCCAQMTFDGSRLVDTACCGFSHLQAAGLAVLRQRYQPAVLENMRSSFVSDDEFDSYVRSCKCSPDAAQGQGAGQGAATTFATTFARVTSVVLEAEEAVQREARQLAADSGHVVGRPGGSRRGSPGGGSQSGSPLARMRQSVSSLTSRLMPASLPQLLPSGAVDSSGQELSPLSHSSGSSLGPSPLSRTSARRASSSSAQPPSAEAGQQEASPALQPISVAGRRGSGALASPTPGLSGSAGSGAVLARRLPALTPFSLVVEGLVGDEQQLEDRQQMWQQRGAQPQEQEPVAASAFAFGGATPQRSGLPPRSPAPAWQSQPGTPSALFAQPYQLSNHRRCMTHDASQPAGHSRRRARLSIDPFQLQNLRPDLAQPAVAAAFAIAANPSPRAAAALSRSLSSLPGVSPLGGGSTGDAFSASAAGGDCADDLLLPIRALRFDDDCSGDGSLGAGTGGAVAGDTKIELQEVPAAPPAERSVLDASGATSSTTTTTASSGTTSSCVTVSSGSSAGAILAWPSEAPRPALASPEHGGQSQHALLSVISRLQEELAVAESRRHAAEQQAAEAAQLVADLRRQLQKVEGQVAAKEALVAELAGKAEASASALIDVDGELRATLMAVETEQQAAERTRHQLAATDALIKRLMAAAEEHSGAKTGSAGPPGAATASTASSSSYGMGHSSPQSSSGSAAGPAP